MSTSAAAKLADLLTAGDQAQALAESTRLLQAGISPEMIVREGVETAMNRLSEKCTLEEFNLLEIMLVGRACLSVVRGLAPLLGSDTHRGRGTVVLASLLGDVHDLGKNILGIILTTNGWRIVDCGKDCPAETVVETAAREHAVAIGISGLITAVIPQARRIRPLALKHGLARVKLLAGGAALCQASARELNVDFVAQSAFDGLRYLRTLDLTAPTEVNP